MNLIKKFCLSIEKNQAQIAIQDGNISYTYKELKESIAFLASLFNQKNFQRLAIMGTPCFTTASSMISALFSQASYVPIDPSWPLNRILAILKDSKTQALITNSKDLKQHSLDKKDFNIPVLEVQVSSKPLFVKEYLKGQLIETHKAQAPLPYPSSFKKDSSLAYIMYTSASSGRAKGVEVSLQALEKFLDWLEQKFQISTQDRFAYISSLGFGASIRQIFSPVLSGAQMFCWPQKLLKAPQELLKEIQDKKITIFNAPPVLLQKIAEQSQIYDLPSLRLVLAGGDLFPKKVAKIWFKTFQHKHQLVNLYGSTESLVNASSYVLSKDSLVSDFNSLSQKNEYQQSQPFSSSDDSPDTKTKDLKNLEYLPIGKARPGLKFFLLDENQQKINTYNKVGELCIQSAYVARSYHNNIKESQKSFIINREDPQKNIYKTGDRALQLSTGDYVLLGRADKQVQIYGQRLELGEIENHLNQHKNIQRAFVLCIEDSGRKQIIAFIQSKNFDEKLFRSFLKKQLPLYMMPHRFLPLDQVPLSPSGKLDYQALAKKAKQYLQNGIIQTSNTAQQLKLPPPSLNPSSSPNPSPDTSSSPDPSYPPDPSYLPDSSCPPDTSSSPEPSCPPDPSCPRKRASSTQQELEKQVKNIWKKYLNPKEFSNQESFFDLGGDSILAVSVYQDLSQSFDVFLDPYIFYQSPTVEKLALAVKKAYQKKNINTDNKKSYDTKTRGKKSTPTFKSLALSLFFKSIQAIDKIKVLFYKNKHLKSLSPQQKHFVWTKKIFNELYNGCFSVPIDNTFDKEKLKQALKLVVQNQESLRTVFIGEKQIILPEFPPDLLTYDLKSYSKQKQQEFILKQEDQLLKYPFQLSKLPLFKIQLLELSSSKAHLIFCVNHVIGDGWSLQAFLSFLNECYAFLDHKISQLTRHSYLDYTKKYKKFCRQVYLNNQAYWDKKLSQYESYNVSSRFETGSLTEESLILDTKIKLKIHKFCETKKISLFDFLLFIWSKTLQEFLDGQKICFFTTYHGRDFPLKNIQNLVGSIARFAPIFIDQKLQNLETSLPILKESYLQSLKHKDYNIFKALFFNPKSQFKNNIAFNYLDFQALTQLGTHLPFSMDWNSAKVLLSSSKKDYQKVYLFFSIHSYPNRLELRAYGQASPQNKQEILQNFQKRIQAEIN